MEPKYWYYPVRQSLGAAPQLMAGHAEAAATFRAALIDAPNNGWALWGLMEAQRPRATKPPPKTEQLFDKAWAGSAPPDLARL